jgi:hypothetical protein
MLYQLLTCATESQMAQLDAREMYQVLQNRVDDLEHHMDQRISNIDKIFVTTMAPLVETLDILVRQQVLKVTSALAADMLY